MSKLPPPDPAVPVASVSLRCARAGALAALGLFATDVGYGFLAFAPLGNGIAAVGIIAAFLTSVIGSAVPALIGGSGPSFGGPRPAQILILSALIATLVGQTGRPDVLAVLALAALCGMLSGLFQIGFGLLNLGRFVRFTPLPVLAGFTNGVALSMLLAAAAVVLGIASPTLASVFGPDTLLRTLAVLALLALMGLTYRLLPVLHWSLTGLIAGSALYFWLDHPALGTTLPGVADVQLPVLTLLSGVNSHLLDVVLAHLNWIVVPALSIAVLNSLESLVIANQQDQIIGSRHDSARVLVGQGIANLLCGACGALPTAPSNSRMHVSAQLGGRTQTTSLAFALTMLLLLVATPHFVASVPKLAVAAVLVYMALAILDNGSKRQLRAWWRGGGAPTYRAQLRFELAIMLAVMTLAVAFNLIVAMGCGVLLAMVLFIRHNSRSIISRVYSGAKRRSSVMRPARHGALLSERGDAICLVELDGPLFFGSGDLLAQEIEHLARDVRFLILDFRQVSTLDASGASAITRIQRALDSRQVRLALASISPIETRGRLIRESGDVPVFAARDWFDDADLALEAAEDALLADHADDASSRSTADELGNWLRLDAAAVAVLMERARVLQCKKDDVLFRRKEAGDRFYLLLEGRIEIRVPVRSGTHSRRLIAMRPGTLLGEMAVLRGAPRSADALASQPSTLLEIRADALESLSRSHPDIALALFRAIGVQLSSRLADITDELRYMLAGSEADAREHL